MEVSLSSHFHRHIFRAKLTFCDENFSWLDIFFSFCVGLLLFSVTINTHCHVQYIEHFRLVIYTKNNLIIFRVWESGRETERKGSRESEKIFQVKTVKSNSKMKCMTSFAIAISFADEIVHYYGKNLWFFSSLICGRYI